jgi:hypothetical protein
MAALALADDFSRLEQVMGQAPEYQHLPNDLPSRGLIGMVRQLGECENVKVAID